MPNSLLVWTFYKCTHSFQNYSMFPPTFLTNFSVRKQIYFWLLGCVILVANFGKIGRSVVKFLWHVIWIQNHVHNQFHSFIRQTARQNGWMKSEIPRMPNSLLVWIFSKCAQSFQNYSMFLPSLPTDFTASKNFDFWLLGCVILMANFGKNGQHVPKFLWHVIWEQNHVHSQFHTFIRQTVRRNGWMKSEIPKMPNPLLVWLFAKCADSF